VVDGSAPEEERLEMIHAVEDVLAEIGAEPVPTMLVLGKVDLLDEEGRAELRHRHPDSSLVSAVSGEGLGELTERVEHEFARRLKAVELLIPYTDGGRLAELHAVAGDLVREETPDGVRVSARLPASVAERFTRFAVPDSLATVA
jgi:GTP-binding protein HflX